MAVTFETHQGLAARKIRGWITHVMPKFPARDVLVTIENGLHEGCSTTLSGPTLSIGKAAKNHIVLLDKNIAQNHALLSLDRSIFGDVIRVKSSEKDVFLAESAVPNAEYTGYEPLPAKLKFGNINLSILSTANSKPLEWEDDGPNQGPIWFRLLPVVPLIALFFLALDIVPNPFETRSRLINEPDNQLTTVNVARTDVELINDIHARLKANGLIRFLTITQTEPNEIRIHGSVPNVIEKEWRATQMWFDSIIQDQILISEVSVESLLVDFPAIATVKISGPSHVLFQSGLQAKIGEIVKDGWAIKSISDDELTVTRGLETINVLY